jgi:hypothetical protein
MATITVDRVIQRRDVDAALYLLDTLLGLKDAALGERRERLMTLKRRLGARRAVIPEERTELVRLYNEVMFGEGRR